jgi:hypothetical protein
MRLVRHYLVLAVDSACRGVGWAVGFYAAVRVGLWLGWLHT